MKEAPPFNFSLVCNYDSIFPAIELVVLIVGKPLKIFNLKIIGRLIENVMLNLHSLISSSSHYSHYRLSSIDQDNQTAILHVIQKSIFIKLTFAEIISNTEMIEGLSSKDACWIGVYYGIAVRRALKRKENLKNIKKPSYLLHHKYGSYKIVCENRDGSIGCIHLKTRQELNIDPLSIAKDEGFIKQFDANQACYIGILAGIAMEKNGGNSLREIKQLKVPYLRVVK